MAKHMMEMNNRLRASLLKLAQYRLLQNAKNEKPTNKKRKRLNAESLPPLQEEEQVQAQ